MKTVKLRKVAVLGLILSSLPAIAMDSQTSADIDAAINNLIAVKQAQTQQIQSTDPIWNMDSVMQLAHSQPFSTQLGPAAGKKKDIFHEPKYANSAYLSSTLVKGSPPALAAAHATKVAKSSSEQKCALYVRRALQKAGYTNFTPQPSAYMYASVMPKLGFTKISKKNYTPATGDVIVWNKKPGNPHGHIQIYNGSQWISDFRQSSMYIYGQNHNGYSIWRDLKHHKKSDIQLAMNDD